MPARSAGALRCSGRRLAVALALLPAAAAAAPLRLTADVALDAHATVHVTATNDGAAPVEDVRPDVAWERATTAGEPLASLAAGASHTWAFALPPPPGPGTFAATIRATYRAGARTERAVVAEVVATPGAPPSPVEATLRVEPVAGYGTSRVTLDDRSDQPVVGRVVVLLGAELATEPESRAVQIAPRGRTEVPIDVRDVAAHPGDRLPITVLFEFEIEGVHHAVVRTAALPIADASRAPVRPLIVGAAALAVAVAIAAGAVARTRRGRAVAG